jgi:hypothetical protein
MSSTFNTNRHHFQFDSSVSTPPPLPVKHWSQTCHDTILSSDHTQYSLQLPLAGGAENGRFVYVNESVSILKTKAFVNIIKGSKIDSEEIILELDHHPIAGCTLADVEQLVERCSANGKHMQLKTVKSGM